MACAPASNGGIHEFAQYTVELEVTDTPDINTSAPSRELMFLFQGDDANTRSQCAWFGDATATFAGQPVSIKSPGGWDTYEIPTNTAPGQSISAATCEMPFVDLEFMNPVGEPQNGVLAIDGSGLHFEVPYMKSFGTPEATLVSSAPDAIVVGLSGFATPPALADVAVMLLMQSSSGAAGGLQEVAVTKALDANGTLTLTPTPAIVPPFDGSLTVLVNLGTDVLACKGFEACTARSTVQRNLDIGFRSAP
jgi:hypothetical protein